MRWPILAALALLLCACAHLDASDLDSSDLDGSDRERQLRAWHACTRDQMAVHGWLNCQ